MNLLFSLLLIFSPANSGTTLNIDVLRNNYEKAANDEQLCKKMLEQLDSNAGSTLYMAYLGAYQAMYAGHAKTPSEKLKLFKEGKNNIEAAIKAAPTNVELRFIRLSIQKKAPAFLGYSDKIEQDKKFIKENLHSLNSAKLKAMCNQLIS